MAEFLAIFDVDGTLVDSQHVIHATMAQAFAEAERDPPDRRTVTALVGLSLPRMVEALLPEVGEAEQDRVVAAYRLRFVEAMAEGGEPPLYEGAVACLDTLEAAGVTLALATGKSQRGLDRLLDTMGWHGRFSSVQCADHHPSKPHPSMIRRALAEAGVAAERSAMIGDTSFDMEMARAAGVAAFGVGWGYHDGEALRAAGAGTVFDDFAALAAHLREAAR